jgi:hypothetical protein
MKPCDFWHTYHLENTYWNSSHIFLTADTNSEASHWPWLQQKFVTLVSWCRNIMNKFSRTQLDGARLKVCFFFMEPPGNAEAWEEYSYLSDSWLRRIWKSRVAEHHVEIQQCVGNISNWPSISPEPCTALRVSESPNLPLMLSGAVNWARYTFVGPISFLQTLIASCRANMCTSDGPLQDNQTITGHNDEKCLAKTCMMLSTTKVLVKYIYRLYRKRIRCWLVNQHWIWWRGLGDTQRQARELISGQSLGAKARFLSFNRTQSRAVTCLLAGHNTPRRRLHLMGLSGSLLCRRCGA